MRAAQAQQAQAGPLVDRAGAYLVDSLVTALIWGSIVLALTGGEVNPDRFSPAEGRLASMTFLVIPFAYFVSLEGVWGTTPGKRVFGLSVRDTEGDQPGVYGATVRNVLRLAWSLGPVGPAFLALDAGLIQWTEHDVRIGDHAAGTRVERTREPLLPGWTRS